MSNTLKHGLHTLELLAQAPCSAAEVARHLQVDRSTAWRILQVLIELEWVRQDVGGGPFTLNVTRLYSLAGNGHEQLVWPGLVTPTLVRIRDRLGESAILGVPSGSSMVYLVFVPSTHAVTVREAIGSVRPMHASALGKAYLSALSDYDLEQTMPRLDFKGATEKAVKSVAELRQTVAATRGQGYATDIEECIPGVICVGVPVIIKEASLLIGSLAVNGPRERMITLGVEYIARVLKEESTRLEMDFARADGALVLA